LLQVSSTENICAILFSLIRLDIAVSAKSISLAATLPFQSVFSISFCEITISSDKLSWVAIIFCLFAGKASIILDIVCGQDDVCNVLITRCHVSTSVKLACIVS